MLVGMAARLTGDLELANSAFTRAHSLTPNDLQIANIQANSVAALGRTQEALDLFEVLIDTQPDFFDAHINRAITADEAGQHDRAIGFADMSLNRFQGNGRLLAIKAMAQKNAGDIADALNSFSAAISVQPDNALTRYNHATTMLASGDYSTSVAEFAEAIRLGKNDLQAHKGLAAALLEKGQVESAVERYEQILAAVPDDAEAAQALSRIIIEYALDGEPFAHFEARARHSSMPEAWREWQSVLIGHEDYAAAAQVGEEAFTTIGDHPDIAALSAFSRAMIGDAGKELPVLKRLSDAPHGAQYRHLLAQVALKAGDPMLTAQTCEAAIADHALDYAAWAYLATAWRIMGDEREHWLCDYDRLVMPIDVPDVETGIDAVAFATEVANCLDRWHGTVRAPGNQSLRGGTQTSGALFDRIDPVLKRFKAALTAQIAAAVATLPDDPTHPFLSRKTRDFKFAGSWSVRLQSAGHHVPHFHPAGWISSAYYARLPDIMSKSPDGQQGWIGFGAPPAILGLDLPPRKMVEPRAGRLVLFPSYMWHGTMPFEGEESRLTAAFDVVPV